MAAFGHADLAPLQLFPCLDVGIGAHDRHSAGGIAGGDDNGVAVPRIGLRKVDVMLVLLLIFIITAPLFQHPSRQ